MKLNLHVWVIEESFNTPNGYYYEIYSYPRTRQIARVMKRILRSKYPDRDFRISKFVWEDFVG